ncbi:acyl-CoA dehydrogenase [Burkholderia sp. SJ98]|nr:acyl-CoA dehydrogenase [Burkholderia sp. SJ98]
MRWQRILYQHGWGAPGWPAEFGGTGWSALQRLLFDIECGIAGAPRQLPFGLNMIGPVLMKFASKAQQARFLPRIPTAEDWWCQGYSEPGAGSDLASLKTRAVRDGDHYIVNGQKTWTTYAQHADWMFCLVRTDPGAKPQSGISLLLIDMKSPGITVRPIRTLEGLTDVNEVFIDEVKVPVENLVGEENCGWTYAKYLLGHERTGIAGIGNCRRELNYVKALAQRERRHGKPLADDLRVREKIACIEAEVLALEMLLMRVASQASQRGAGVESSILKIRGSELQQSLSRCNSISPGRMRCRSRPTGSPTASTDGRPIPVMARASAASIWRCASRPSTAARTRCRRKSLRKRSSRDEIGHGLFIQRRTAPARGQPEALHGRALSAGGAPQGERFQPRRVANLRGIRRAGARDRLRARRFRWPSHGHIRHSVRSGPRVLARAAHSVRGHGGRADSAIRHRSATRSVAAADRRRPRDRDARVSGAVCPLRLRASVDGSRSA